jgi:hypothetical protein
MSCMGYDEGSRHTRALVIVGIEAAGQPCDEGHLDEEDNGVEERLSRENGALVFLCLISRSC